MKGRMDYVHTPAFRLEPSGALTLRASEEAARVARTIQEEECTGVVRVLKPRQVKAKAKACVVARGGDPDDSRLVDSESAIQFGKYRGQTFKWLLSHDVGYAVMVLASHQQEREMGDTDTSSEMANKDRFDWYTNLFPEVQKAVEERRVRDETLPPRPDQEDTATAVAPLNPSAEPSDQELLSICMGFDQALTGYTLKCSSYCSHPHRTPCCASSYCPSSAPVSLPANSWTTTACC
ncbi:uncharacterized protein [Salvelinus alpinus]|uniref:uncharacterized protein isoform X1 n=2 Tax=Salvelinus alpinus TaxID=8036 RepID=UPI0039FB9E74